MRVLVTGGSGFIGSAIIKYLLSFPHYEVLNVDKLTYAANQAALESIADDKRYSFCNLDICDGEAIEKLFETWRPDRVMHLAAESHVDRSIKGPRIFIETNVIGTLNLLEASRRYLSTSDTQGDFLFHHVSTDEVYGDLGEQKGFFTEDTPYKPSSPYSASKASSDHLVKAWYRTYGLPCIVTNCSNNYGPFQASEKLIPTVINKALAGEAIPIYGDGQQIRDWLYVEDHARALEIVMSRGKVGETYNIGGHNEHTNLYVVKKICEYLRHLVPRENYDYESLVTFVSDRPGHDIRYAIDAKKIAKELAWTPTETFETGLLKTVQWYVSNT